MITSEHYCLSCGAANKMGAEVCFACGCSLKITAPLEEDAVGVAGKTGRPLLKQRYRIIGQVGDGGFSVVYRAEDTLDGNRKVAIKAITLHGLQSQEIIEATEAFNREMLMLSELQHRNLPRVRDHFSDTRCWYLVMDFIEGTALEKHLERMPGGRLPLEEALDIGYLLCNVLVYLHGRQPPVIFRDLKPSNVILTADGHLALIDFGIARRFKPGQQKDTMVFGSPGYAAPEQYGKAQTTPRADIYSLGALLHQLLTGDEPAQNAFHFEPIEAKGDETLQRLNVLILCMVELDEKNRPESIVIVAQELHAIAEAYMQRRMEGLQASDVVPYMPVKPSWQTTGLLRVPGDAALSAATQAQMTRMYPQQAWLPLHQQQQSSTSGAGGNAYYNPPASGATSAAPRRNGPAVASMLFGILTLVMPLFVCTFGSSLAIPYAVVNFQMLFMVVFLTLLVPALLAIIFGHIALNRCKKNPRAGGVGMAKTGLMLGYIFGSIYLLILCYIFSGTFFTWGVGGGWIH